MNRNSIASKRHWRRRLVTALGLALLLLLSAGGQPTIGAPAPIAPGITDDTITIGATMPLTGAIAGSVQQYRDGADAYFRWINERGGINGRKVNWKTENDDYNPQQALSLARKLVERDNVFALVACAGTANTLSVVPYVVEKGVPLIGTLAGDARLLDSKEKWIFGIVPLGTAMGESVGRYVATELRGRRVAIFFQNDQYGKDGRDGAIAGMKTAGIDPVISEGHEPNVTDVSSIVLKIKNANPDVVIMYSIPRTAAMFLREARTQGFRPQFIGPNPLADPLLGELAGAEAVEGVILNYFIELGASDDPRIKSKVDILHKYYPRTQPGYAAFNGIVSAMVFVEGARKVGRNLTRETLIQGMERIQNFQTGLTGAITYGPGKRSGLRQFGFAQWQNGQVRKITGWR